MMGMYKIRLIDVSNNEQQQFKHLSKRWVKSRFSLLKLGECSEEDNDFYAELLDSHDKVVERVSIEKKIYLDALSFLKNEFSWKRLLRL